jgi:hypothetical protein
MRHIPRKPCKNAQSGWNPGSLLQSEALREIVANMTLCSPGCFATAEGRQAAEVFDRIR